MTCDILCEVWDIDSGCTDIFMCDAWSDTDRCILVGSSLAFHPLLLDFSAAFSVVTRAFFKYFASLEASVTDIEKVFQLVRSQVRFVLRGPAADATGAGAQSALKMDSQHSDNGDSASKYTKQDESGWDAQSSVRGESQRGEDPQQLSTREASPYYSKELDLSIYAFEKAMLDTPIKVIRERQLAENETEDLLLRRLPIRYTLFFHDRIEERY